MALTVADRAVRTTAPDGSRRTRGRSGQVVTAWLIGLPVALAVLAMTGSRRINAGDLLNSDAVYLPVLVQDVAAGGTVSDWFLPPAPYFFPDMLLFWPIGLVASSTLYAQQAYAVLQVLLFTALLGVVGGLVCGRRAGLITFALGAALIVPLSAVDMFGYLSLSAHHAGALLVAVAGLVVLAQCPLASDRAGREPRPWPREGLLLVLLSTLTAASTLSDALYVIQFSVPIVTSLVLMSIAGLVRWRWCLFATVAIGVGHLVGTLLYPHTVSFHKRTGFPVSFGNDRLMENLSYVGQLADGLLHTAPWAVGLLVLGHGAAVVALLTRRRWSAWLSPQQAVLAAMWLLWSLLSSAALLVALLTLESQPAASRYLVGAALAGPATLALVLGVLLRHAALSPAAPAILASAALLVSTVFVATSPPAIGAAALEARAACLEKATAGASAPRGLAGYWTSKQVYALSGGDVVTAAVTPDLEPFHEIASSDWFRPPFGFLVVKPSAALADAPEVQALTSQGGVVRSQTDCAGTVALVLDQPFTPAGWSAEP